MSPLSLQCHTGTQKDFFRPGAGFLGDGVPQPHSFFAIAPAGEEGVGVKVAELKEFQEDKKMQQDTFCCEGCSEVGSLCTAGGKEGRGGGEMLLLA